ncbi:hypothetical protein EIP91_005893 [Steccherinum ochraceum]|uniref:Uncharacterized protein n=1 Tax=Steccherinum ochraceum TaxID=92696 RepID=A0A4R0RCI2_9APHY|nr:hypothetical protein EIP91_005893 [Steccherinum ochraceum]
MHFISTALIAALAATAALAAPVDIIRRSYGKELSLEPQIYGRSTDDSSVADAIHPRDLLDNLQARGVGKFENERRSNIYIPSLRGN